MKTLSILFISAFGSILVATGILKKATAPHIEKMAMLIEKKWQMTDETTFAKGKTFNTFKDYKTCVSDDLFTFLPDGNLIQDDNKEKCSTNQKKITNGIWAFNIQDKNKIEMALSMQITAEIVDINDTSMVLKYENQVGDIVTQTYTKQKS